jgi:hypothetical protein
VAAGGSVCEVACARYRDLADALGTEPRGNPGKESSHAPELGGREARGTANRVGFQKARWGNVARLGSLTRNARDLDVL